MYAMDALKQAAKNAGVPNTHIGKALGYADNYVARIVLRGSTPQCDTMAKMLGVCGYALCAVPIEQVTDSMYEITPKDD